jgi:predicted MFS family arabinose efflux permease
VRDAPPGHPFLDRTPEPPRQMLQGLVEVLRNPRMMPILAMNFCNYACTFTVQGLWGGPFLREAHGLSAIEAGNVLLAAVVTYQLGILAFGPLDRVLDTRKWIAICGTMVTVAMLATLALAAQPPVWVPVGAILCMGFFGAASSMVMTHGRGIFPDRLIGRGVATMNTAVMLGVACMQTFSGIIVGAFEPLADGARSETAYRALFGVLTAILVVAVAIYSRSQDVRPTEEMRLKPAARV